MASGQSISEYELINFILVDLGAEYDATVMHILSRLDVDNESMTLAEAKFLLQKCEQRLSRSLGYSFDIQGCTTNLITGTN